MEDFRLMGYNIEFNIRESDLFFGVFWNFLKNFIVSFIFIIKFEDNKILEGSLD